MPPCCWTTRGAKESTSGPPRKYYTLTEAGRQFLSELRQTWEDMAVSVGIIRQPRIL